MPTRQGASLPKYANTCERRSVRRTKTSPAPSTPCTWKTFFAKTSPIVLTLFMDGLRSLVLAITQPWHIDAVRGPSTPSMTDAAESTMRKATTTMKRSKSSPKEGQGGDSPSQLIDARIKELSDWRGATLARVRSLIKQADPEVVEEWKWRGVPVWSHAGT